MDDEHSELEDSEEDGSAYIMSNVNPNLILPDHLMRHTIDASNEEQSSNIHFILAPVRSSAYIASMRRSDPDS